jgi:soluble lytic murein transglycosylase
VPKPKPPAPQQPGRHGDGHAGAAAHDQQRSAEPRNAERLSGQPLNDPQGAGPPLSGGRLIGFTCLLSLLALIAARQLLQVVQRPLDPGRSMAELKRSRHWSVDPQRRREAALLLSAREGATPVQRRLWLRGQGWGPGPVAAVSLKQAALASQDAGRAVEAEGLWQQLLERFPRQAASADALYAIGRRSRSARSQLLARFPAHPAALAAAQEDGRAMHLARWGPRWPGAEALLRERCRRRTPALSASERRWLAGGLMQLGDGRAALDCLGPVSAPSSLQLDLAGALLSGGEAEQRLARRQLSTLLRADPGRPGADDALRLLAQQPGPEALAELQGLPAPLRQRAPVQARLAREGLAPWNRVLQRWPRDPSSWDLQWDLARQALLQRRWHQADALLSSLDSRQLPAPLAARLLFWQGYSAWRQGAGQRAATAWRRVLAINPSGYYAWRAQRRLGMTQTDDPRHGARTPVAGLVWQPLASGQEELDTFWRLGLPLEAWESWRHRRGGRAAESNTDLMVEGRLRTAIGDDWTGLNQLDQASLRLPQTSCQSQWQRDLQQHPRRFLQAFSAAATGNGLDSAVLLAVARQESRFSPSVSSAVGARGLMQLMPETAAELAGGPLPPSALQDPQRNAELGALHLRQLLDRWNGDPFLAVASYNAGAGAVQGWLGAGMPDVKREPELWTEAIPYPETRLYTKKVLGNYWTYRLGERAPC